MTLRDNPWEPAPSSGSVGQNQSKTGSFEASSSCQRLALN